MKISGRGKHLLLTCEFNELEVAKKLKGRWNAKYKGFTFPPSIVTFHHIIESLQNLGVQFTIDENLRAYFVNKKKRLNLEREAIEYKTKPYPYQELMTALIVSKRKAFIFGGVGTGKSKASIDAVVQLWRKSNVQKALVVCPASIMWNFKNEVGIHSNLDATVVSGPLKKRQEAIITSDSVFDILNYEMVGKLSDVIQDKGYDMVIFDEIHYCKSRTSTRSKACYKISRDIPIRIGLTGTIISNDYEDLFMPYKIVDDLVLGTNYTMFKNRFFLTSKAFGYDEVVGYKNEDELKKLIATNSIKFDIRDVIKDLPPETISHKVVRLSPASNRLYKNLKTTMIADYKGGKISATNVLERLLRLSQLTSGFIKNPEDEICDNVSSEKLDILKEILTGTSDKAIVFCRFRHSIDRVRDMCESLGLSCYVYDGRTKEKDLYLKFNADDTRVWIAQLSKSEGYSIPSARYCIFYELDYSRRNHIQAKGRILRASGSPHDSIFYIYLVAENTVDDEIYKTLQEKDFNSDNALSLVRGEFHHEHNRQDK